jgi:HK97 family phage portal protein
MLVDPKILHAQIRASFDSQLPQAIHDATGELVERIVESQVAHELAPYAGDWLEKAQNSKPKLSQTVEGSPQAPRGLLYDPFTALDQMGYRERPSALTFRTLREMRLRCPPVAAVVQTRMNQMSAFAEPQADEHSMGFKIVLRDKHAAMTPELEREADAIEKWILRSGNPDIKIKRPRFNKLIRQMTDDTLTYDQMTTEIIPDRRGLPSYWRALDASTIRISDDLDETDETDDSIQYVQIYDDTIIAEFTDEQLLFGVRNPRTDIRLAGYGTSELELLIIIVTSLLNGIAYNSKFFSQGSVAKGMINFKGAIPDKELAAFRRNWYAMITGVDNAWRTPIVNSDEVQWVNMHTSNRDMEFANWIDWLLKVTCSIFQIAPEEIGFQFGNSGGGSSLNEGNQEQKLKYSRDKGLVPLARFMADEIDREVIERLDDRFCLRFVGINAMSPGEAIELIAKEVKSIKTVNEARAERDMDPIEGGDIILDSNFIQYLQGMQGGEDEGGDGLDARGLDEGNEPDDYGEDGPDDADDPGEPEGGGPGDQKDLNADGEIHSDAKVQKSLRGPRILNLEIDL